MKINVRCSPISYMSLYKQVLVEAQFHCVDHHWVSQGRQSKKGKARSRQEVLIGSKKIAIKCQDRMQSRPFSQQTFWLTVVTKTLMMTPDSSVPMNHNSVTVSQHAQQQDPDTEAATIYFRYNSFHYLHICFFCCNMSKCLQWKRTYRQTGRERVRYACRGAN